MEIGGSLALVLGVRLRWTAFILAGFIVLVTTIFHWDFAKEMNVHFFRKDLAIAGDYCWQRILTRTAKRYPGRCPRREKRRERNPLN